MGYFQCGDFIIGNLNQGFSVGWTTPKGVHVTMQLDISRLIHEHIDRHIYNITRLIHLLNAPEYDAILNDTLGYEIINYWIPDADMIPGQAFKTQAEADEFRNKQFLAGYNAKHATNFSWDLIKGCL